MSRTTIQVTKKTHVRLKNIGKMGDTMDRLINRLIDRYLEIELEKQQ